MSGLSKKGMSSVVQTSLITMLSIMAISMVWGYVSDLSNNFENQLSPTIDCISQKSEISNACVNSDGKVELSLDIGIEEKISKLDIRYLEESFSCGQTCSSCDITEEKGSKKIYIDTKEDANVQDSITVSINNCLPETLVLSQC